MAAADGSWIFARPRFGAGSRCVCNMRDRCGGGVRGIEAFSRRIPFAAAGAVGAEADLPEVAMGRGSHRAGRRGRGRVRFRKYTDAVFGLSSQTPRGAVFRSREMRTAPKWLKLVCGI